MKAITRMKIFSAGGNGIIKKQRNMSYECFVLLGILMPFELCRVLTDLKIKSTLFISLLSFLNQDLNTFG